MTDIEQVLAGRYRIERELGRGGMGAVYLARDLKLDRSVALKVLPPEFAANSSLRERFLRETRTAASFSHPNIVPVHAGHGVDRNHRPFGECGRAARQQGVERWGSERDRRSRLSRSGAGAVAGATGIRVMTGA